MTKFNDYQKSLVSWICNLIKKNQNDFNYNNIQDITIGLFLLSKDLKFNKYLENNLIDTYVGNHSYNPLVKKIFNEIKDKNIDIIDVIKMISDKEEYSLVAKHDNSFTELYVNDKLSVDEGNSLIFGDNILYDDIMTPRELNNQLIMLTKDTILDFLADIVGVEKINMYRISFNIPEETIMFLKDSMGFKITSVVIKDQQKTVIRYTSDDVDSLFLLFNICNYNNGKIYGISINMNNGNRRDIILISKDKDEFSYKFLGGDI